MNTKPRTTFKCRWVPRRSVKRTFKARDVARIWCAALEDGETEGEIEAAIKVKCDPDRKGRQIRDTAVLEMAVAVAEANIVQLNEAYNLFLLVNGLLLGLLALPALLRRSPGLIVAFRAVARAQSSVAAQVTVIGRTVAANESLYTAASVALRRAA